MVDHRSLEHFLAGIPSFVTDTHKDLIKIHLPLSKLKPCDLYLGMVNILRVQERRQFVFTKE